MIHPRDQEGSTICCEILHGSKVYTQSLALRYEVLRKPLGLMFNPNGFPQENKEWHLGVMCADWLVACLIMTPEPGGKAKMRQVAVHEEWQGLGVGKRLVAFAEKMCEERGVRHIHLNARETAVPFYLTMGYQVVGDRFEEVGIPHFRMEKAW